MLDSKTDGFQIYNCNRVLNIIQTTAKWMCLSELACACTYGGGGRSGGSVSVFTQICHLIHDVDDVYFGDVTKMFNFIAFNINVSASVPTG